MNERLAGILKSLGLLDEAGNFIVGKGNIVEAPDGQVTDTVMVGENEVISKADPATRVTVAKNKLFGKNKITIE